MIKRREDRAKQNRVDILAGHYLDSNSYQSVEQSISVDQTLCEMADDARIQVETGTSCSVLALCSNFTDPAQYDHQCQDLRAFVNLYTGEDKVELRRLLGRVLSHLYVDAWERGAPKVADALLGKYADGFADDQMIKLRETAVLGQSRKVPEQIEIELSQEAASSLMHFIGRRQNVLLRNVVERCCHIRVKLKDRLPTESSQQNGSSSMQKKEAQTNLLGEEQSGLTVTNHDQMDSDQTENDPVVHLRNIISQVKEIRESAPLPSVCLHTFYNVSRLGLTNVTFSPDSTILCGTFEDSSVRLWSRLGDTFKGSDEVDQIGFDSSHSSLNLPSGLHPREVTDETTDEQEKDTLMLRGHSSAVYSASFTQDSRYLLSASGDTSVRLWDVKTQHNMVLYKGHTWPVWDVAFSPVDYYFATASFDRTARLWRTDATHPLRIFTGHISGVNCVQFHPNCSYLATGSSDGTCRLWSVQSGQYVRLFNKHLAPVRGLAFSPDGKQLASASDDRRVLLWDIGTGKVLSEMASHKDKVYTVDFSQDGLLLASSGEDGSIQLWNTKGEVKEAGCFTAKSCAIQRVQFCKNNLLLAAGVHTSHR